VIPGLPDHGRMASGAAVFVAAAIAFWLYALYDFTRTDPRAVRTFSRQTWLLLLVFTSVFGALLWFSRGRPEPPRRR